ncbi:MAG: helix-turn-helix domain-containing protein [Proteobacteria bacterium]|nr:helix-turn-helix domain-containing protein [Pseudomonadota bacterium]
MKRQASGGMSRDAYCAWHGLSRSTLYRWERRLRAPSALESMEWIAVEPPGVDAAWPWPLSLQRPAGC